MMDIAKHWRLARRRPSAGSSSQDPLCRTERERRIVAHLSRGNIRLQRGEYVTREELTKQFERAKAHDFGSE